MLLLKGQTLEPRGRRACPGRGQRGPAWMGVPPKNTHQSSLMTSPPSRPIGRRRRRGRGNARNRRDGPCCLNEPTRHQCTVQVPTLPGSGLGEKRTEVGLFLAQAPAFTRLPCVLHRGLLYAEHICSLADTRHTNTHMNGRLLFILRAAVKCKQSSESQRGLIQSSCVC